MIKQALNLLFKPGDVIELRILNAGKNGTVSGYFNDFDKLAEVAARYSRKVPAVYVTLNPVSRALLARVNNKVVAKAKNLTTDSEVIGRRWLPIDFDPVRPSGVSSTDAEHELALKRALTVKQWLGERGWPEPIYADSGNGAHLLYRIDLPNNDRARDLIKKCLEVLALFHSDEKVAIDTSVHNAARIWKLYGTLTCKGENLSERPHRMAKILEVPQEIKTVTREQLQELARLLPDPPKERRNYQGDFDLERWIAEHNLPVVQEKNWAHGRVWVLNLCPFNKSHTNKSAYIIQFTNGAIAAGCHHNSCQGKDWHTLRDIYEPGWRDKRKEIQNDQKRKESVEKPVVPVLVWLSNIQPVEVNWLWEQYIPKGKLTILEGDPGMGKTWLALAITAIVSRGWSFPGADGIPDQKAIREPANVLYLSAEDGMDDTLRPRLDKAGADVSRVCILTGKQNGDETVEPPVLTDTALLRGALTVVKPALLVIDPIQAFLGASVDMHRANEVRPILMKLAALAKEFNCAVLCIRHLGKGQQDRAIYRGLGSIDFSAAARSILLAGQDPDDPNSRAVIHIKSSLALAGPSIGYEIREDGFTGLVFQT